MSCKKTSSLTIFRLAPRSAVLLALASALAACAADPPANDGLSAATAEPTAARPEIPPDAIPVTNELYMLPMGTDERGCPVFQPWSPTLAVVQALHWRTAAGAFTLDRDAAACPPDDGP